MVSEKTGCSSGFIVNQYKHLCEFSLSLISLNSVFIFVNWYKQPIVSSKQPIVSSKQPIVFLVLCLFALCFGKLNSYSSVSRSNFILDLKVCENPF